MSNHSPKIVSLFPCILMWRATQRSPTATRQKGHQRPNDKKDTNGQTTKNVTNGQTTKRTPTAKRQKGRQRPINHPHVSSHPCRFIPIHVAEGRHLACLSRSCPSQPRTPGHKHQHTKIKTRTPGHKHQHTKITLGKCCTCMFNKRSKKDQTGKPEQ